MRFALVALSAVALAATSTTAAPAAPYWNQWLCNKDGFYWFGPDQWCDTKKNVEGWCFNGGDVHNGCRQGGVVVQAAAVQQAQAAPAASGGWTSGDLPGKLTFNQMLARYPAVAPWRETILSACGQYRSVPPNLVAALIMQESHGNAGAVNWNDSPPAIGLMQIKNGPSEPWANVHRGVGLLQQGFNQYGDWHAVLRWYNSGAPQWNGAGTWSYVDDILYGWMVGNRY